MKKYLTLFIILLMASCLSIEQSPKRTITLWTFSPITVRDIEKHIADIETKFNIELKVRQIDQKAFLKKLKSVYTYGYELPDIIEWKFEDNRILYTNPQHSYVMPLNRFIQTSALLQKAKPANLDKVTYNRNIYGLPGLAHPAILVYNDTIWKSVGVDLARINTWDDFFKASKKLVKKTGDNGQQLHYALPYGNDGLNNTMYMIWQQSGAQIFDKKGSPQFTSPQFKTFLQKWLAWQKTGSFIMWDWANFSTMLHEGKLCSYISPDWWIPQSSQAAKKYTFKVRTLPVYKKNGPVGATWGGTFLAIPKGVKDPQRVYNIMEYIRYNRKSAGNQWSKYNYLPAHPAFWKDPALNGADQRFSGQKTGSLLVRSAQEIPPVTVHEHFWNAIKAFTINYQDIAANKISSDTGLERTQNQTLQYIKQAPGTIVTYKSKKHLTSDTKAPKRVITLWTFASNNTREWQTRKAEIERTFNIQLNIKLVRQNTFVSKLQSAMLNDNGVPDIIEWMIANNRIMNNDPKKSLLIDLNDYIQQSQLQSDLAEGRLEWLTYGSAVYGLPHDVHPAVLVYNDTIWKKAGVDLAEIETWDEFFYAARKLANFRDERDPIQHYALPYGDDGLNNTMFMVWQQTGAQLFDTNGRPQFTSPGFKSFVHKWITWHKSGVFIRWDWGNFANQLYDGTLCSYISPDWWIPQSDKASTEYSFKVRTLPRYRKGGPVGSSWGGSFLGMPRGTKKPELVFQIMAYMQYDKESAIQRWEKTGMLPPLKSAWSHPSFHRRDRRFGGTRLGETMIRAAKDMPVITTCTNFWDSLNDFTPIYNNIFTGNITIDEGLMEAQKHAISRFRTNHSQP